MPLCHNKQYEREFVHNMIIEGHHCERIAGSGRGEFSVCDCILFKNGEIYLVEVKTTKNKEFKPTKVVREQLARMQQTAKERKVRAMLALKKKYRGWELRELT